MKRDIFNIKKQAAPTDTVPSAAPIPFYNPFSDKIPNNVRFKHKRQWNGGIPAGTPNLNLPPVNPNVPPPANITPGDAQSPIVPPVQTAPAENVAPLMPSPSQPAPASSPVENDLSLTKNPTDTDATLITQANQAIDDGAIQELIQQARDAFRSNIMQSAESFQSLPPAAKDSRENAWIPYLPQSLDNFFSGNGINSMRKWISFMVVHAADYIPEFVEPRDPVKTRENILNDIVTDQTDSHTFRVFQDLVLKGDESVWQAIERNAHSVAKGDNRGSGISLNQERGSSGDGVSLQDLIADKNAVRPEELVGQISEDENLQLHDLTKIFMSIPENMDILTETAEECKFPNPVEAIESAVNESFAGLAWGGDHARWMQFYMKNPDLLPGGAGKTNKDQIMKLFDRPEFRQAAIQQLKLLAQANNESLRDFVEEIAHKSLISQSESQRIDQRQSLKGLPNQISKVAKFTSGTMFLNYLRDKEALRNAAPGSPAAKTAQDNVDRSVKYYALSKHKSKSIVNTIDEMIKGKAKMTERGDKIELVLNDGNGRNRMVIKKTKKDTGEVTVEDIGMENSIEDLSSVISPQAWAPKSIDEMIKLEPTSIKRGSKALMARQKAFPLSDQIDAESESLQDRNNPDYLNGWRKSIGNRLSAIIKQLNISPAEIVARSKSRAVTEQCIKDMMAGKPVEYGEKTTIGPIAKALGIQPAAFFSPSKIIDKYSRDDIYNMGEQVDYSFRFFSEFLLHKHEESKKRNLSDFSPTVLTMFLGMMRLNSGISRGQARGKPDYVDDFARLYRMIDRPVTDIEEGHEPAGVDPKTNKPVTKYNPDKAMDTIRQRLKDPAYPQAPAASPRSQILRRQYPGQKPRAPGIWDRFKKIHPHLKSHRLLRFIKKMSDINDLYALKAAGTVTGIDFDHLIKQAYS